MEGRLDSEPEAGDSVPQKKEFAINEPMRPMRKSKAFFAAVCILQFACTSENARKVKLQIPGPSPVNLAEYAEVAITNLRVEKETPDLENKETRHEN